MLPVLSSPPAACSGCAGWVCSSWRTAAARSHSCLSSPVRQNRGNIQHSTTVLTAPPTGPPLLTAPTFFTILLLSRPYMRSSEPQFFTWGWSICRIFWDASCLPTLLFLPVGSDRQRGQTIVQVDGTHTHHVTNEEPPSLTPASHGVFPTRHHVLALLVLPGDHLKLYAGVSHPMVSAVESDQDVSTR